MVVKNLAFLNRPPSYHFMIKRLRAYKISLDFLERQEDLANKCVGCTRLVVNLGLEQRSTYGRRDRRISYQTWSAELKALKDAFPFFAEVPHHCLQQALKDLDMAFARFFEGVSGYPKPRKKFENESFRFPDPTQFKIVKDGIILPKFGMVKAKIHRRIKGRVKNITVIKDAGRWYASIVVEERVQDPAPRPMVEGGIDIGVASPVVESDGTRHSMPVMKVCEIQLKKRLQRKLSRQKKGSKRRLITKQRLKKLEAKIARRRKDAAHKISRSLANKYTHLAVEDLAVKNMTASASGTIEAPGKNVAQKAGLNRAILRVAPGQLRRFITYKMQWNGGVCVAVNPAYTSQTCSECGKHPKDDVLTQHLSHGRLSQSRFVCPLCGYQAHADHNAARNILARGRDHWATSQELATLPQKKTRPRHKGPKPPATGSVVAARGGSRREPKSRTKILTCKAPPPGLNA